MTARLGNGAGQDDGGYPGIASTFLDQDGELPVIGGRLHSLEPVLVCHLITGLDVGGAERMLFRLVTRSDQSRLRHMVVSLTTGGFLADAMRNQQIPVYELGLADLSRLPAATFRLVRLLRRVRPHVLQTWLYHADFLGVLASATLPGCPLIWNLRCSDMDLTRYSRSTRILAKVLAQLSSVPAAILHNAEAVRRTHEERGYRARRWHQIENGIDTSEFRPDGEARRRTRCELGVSEDELIIGVTARYDPVKNHVGLIEAAARVLRKHDDVRFVMAGRGVHASNRTLMEEIRRHGIDGRTVLLGQRMDIAAVMAAFDIAVSPSSGEGFPNVVAEAMACEVPCVVTDVGGSAAVVGETGLVVPPHDSEALAAGIEQLISLPVERRRAMGGGARRRVIERFSLPTIIDRYEAFYRSLAPVTATPGRFIDTSRSH